MRLTIAGLEAAYEYLKATPPLKQRRWRLPHVDDVSFRITREPQFFGTCHRENDGTIVISISELSVSYTERLMWIMAHEMIHLSQQVRKTETKGADHNAEFRRLAAAVCKEHGFDPRGFL